MRGVAADRPAKKAARGLLTSLAPLKSKSGLLCFDVSRATGKRLTPAALSSSG